MAVHPTGGELLMGRECKGAGITARRTRERGTKGVKVYNLYKHNEWMDGFYNVGPRLREYSFTGILWPGCTQPRAQLMRPVSSVIKIPHLPPQPQILPHLVVVFVEPVIQHAELPLVVHLG